MTPQTLDFFFPFLVLAYGLLMTFALNVPAFKHLAQTRMPEQVARQMVAHRGFAIVCLVVGGFWSLQNIWAN